MVAIVLMASVGAMSFVGTVAGATVKCGTIVTETWTARGSPYYVTCDVVVAPGATLTIEAGVSVLVDSGYSIYVASGFLLAFGNASAPVTFDANTSNPTRGHWGGIVAQNYSYIQLYFTTVRHAVIGVQTEASPPPSGSAWVYVMDSEFAENSEWGLKLGSMSNGSTGQGAYLTRAHIHDNGAGISAVGLSLQDSLVQQNDAVGVDVVQDFRGGLRMNGTTVADNGHSGVVLRDAGTGTSAGSSLTCNDIERNGLLSPDPNGTFGLDIQSANPDAAVATVYLNNLADNGAQARDAGRSAFDSGAVGNFWSDYSGSDGDGDGLGDTPYVLDANSQDNFPVMGRIANCQPPPPPPPDKDPGAATPLGAELTGSVDDVTLRWSLSPDDGAGEDDIASYDIYESSTYEVSGAGYALLASLPAGTETYVHAGAGIDGQSHFYRLVVVDAGGHEAASVIQFGKTSRVLTAGSHLLSIPLLQTDSSVATVFRTVDFEVVRTYVNPAGFGKNWQTFHKQKPWATLTEVDEDRAFWVLVTSDSEFVLAGLIPTTATIQLETGWNLVAYRSFTDRTVADALAGANYQTVEGFDSGNTPYQLRRLSDADVMSAGEGFWIHVSAPFDWTLDS